MINKDYKCSITIFTSISLLLIIGLLFSLTEIARMKVNKLYMIINSSEAIDSLFSLYHRDLWDQYNIFGLESYDDDILKKEYMEFVKIPIKDDFENFYENFYLSNINEEDVKFNKDRILDKTNFEDEIVSFMQYGIVNTFIKFGNEIYDLNSNDQKDKILEEIDEKIRLKNESSIYEDLYNKYLNFKKEITELEEYGRNANENVDKYINKINNIKFSESSSESGAKNNINDLFELINYLDKSYNMLKNFRKKMIELRDIISDRKKEYEKEKLLNPNIDINVDKFIHDEFMVYEEYVDDNSEMNLKINAGFESINNTKNDIHVYYEEINSIYNEILYVKENIKEIKKDKELDSDEKKDEIEGFNDELNELYDESKELGKYLNEIKSDFLIDPLGIMVSEKNSLNNTNIFDKILSIKDDGLLALCLDKKKIDELDKNNNIYDNFNLKSDAKLYEKFLIGEYNLNYLNYYGKNELGYKTKSNSEKLEIEYLLTGKSNDKDAMITITNKLFLTREALNLIHIINNVEKKNTARAFVNTLFAPCSIIVKEAMYIATISAWAYAQSISDISKLYDMKNVPFIHSDETWDYNIEDIINISKEKIGTNDLYDEKGLNYKDYLRIYLFIADQNIIDSRLCQTINKNLKINQGNFNMNNIIFGLDIESVFDCRHYFTNFIIFNPDNSNILDNYKMKINMHYDYIENNKE